MRGTENRLNRIEEQLAPNAPCTCKELIITQEKGVEIWTLPACPQHKRKEDTVVKRLKNVSYYDL